MINITQEQIMQNWGVDNSNTPLVSVKCMTYNHELYIAQALDGFLMQKTNFPFEVLIHDDASTDKTADIIREYEAKFPKIVKTIYETENQWSKGHRAHHLKIDKLIKGKYIAVCEGDDYWIDENKLQMQVDFLEKNPDYGMCYTKAKQFLQEKKKFTKRSFGSKERSFEELLQRGNNIPTLTVCIRKSIMENYRQEIQPENKGWLMGDYPLWLYCVRISKSKFLDYETSIYRVLENSASHSVSISKIMEFKKSSYAVCNFFSEKFFNKKITWNYNVQLANVLFLSKKDERLTIKKLLRNEKINNINMLIHKCTVSFKLLFIVYRFYLGRKQNFVEYSV